MLSSEIEKKLEDMEPEYDKAEVKNDEPPDGEYIVKVHSLSFKDSHSDKLGDYLRLTFMLDIDEGDYAGRRLFKTYNVVPENFSWLKRDLKIMDMEMPLKQLYQQAILFTGIVLKVRKSTKKDSQYANIYIQERMVVNPKNKPADDLPF